jgi:hypothetical protein
MQPNSIPGSMAFPSIQSFYQKEGSPPAPRMSKPDDQHQGNGFTAAEVEATLRPLTQTWKPKGTYEEVKISELQPGPGKVRFMGRIVNFSPAKDDPNRRSLLPQGFHFLVVKDDTGVVSVRFGPRRVHSLT